MQIVFHSFGLGDVDDVDIYAAEPILKWQSTDQGRWVMQNATNIGYFTYLDSRFFGNRVDIVGDLEEGPLLTEYLLKWQIKKSW